MLFEDHPLPGKKNYWWLIANPKIWKFYEYEVGQRQTYSNRSEKGNKSRIFKYFEKVKPGDLIICYSASPDKEVVGKSKITKGLHKDEEGEIFEFEIIEQYKNTVKWAEILLVPELQNSEPVINNNQGSLFRLSKDEFEILQDLIDRINPPTGDPVQTYHLEEELQNLFLEYEDFKSIIELIKHKKNLILQGPPGVGKTFIARHIAWAAMGLKDENRIQMVQFHQSYSYEDFVQGFRPDENGGFYLKNGIFFDFCKRAGRDTEDDYFFIIDEINRGNLSKIMGELMMLIEPDKRGNHSIPLTYSKSADETFTVPSNVYLIGTMNTADRSLAMVDYALRRRFCFVDLEPAYGTEKFNNFLVSAGVPDDLVKKIDARLSYLNTSIAGETKNLGPGFRIGHSYFCPGDNDANFDGNWYRNIVNYEIAPLLREYWFDSPEKAKEQIQQLLD